MKNKSVKTVLIVAVSLCIFGGGAYWYISQRAASSQEEFTEEDKKSTNPLYSKARRVADEKGVQASVDVYASKIDNTSSNEKKAQLLLDLAAALWPYDDVAGERTEAAIKYALEAEKLYQSGGSAAALSGYYWKLGDNKNAEKYSKLYEERVPLKEIPR